MSESQQSQQTTQTITFTVERSRPSRSENWGERKWVGIVNLILQLINILFALLLITLAILRFCGQTGNGAMNWSDFGFVIVTIFLILFALMIIFLCLFFPNILWPFFGWFQQMLTRGLFYIFLGAVCISPGWVNYVIGALFVVFGIFYFIAHWIRCSRTVFIPTPYPIIPLLTD